MFHFRGEERKNTQVQYELDAYIGHVGLFGTAFSSPGNYLSGIQEISLDHVLKLKNQAIQLATMDVFLDSFVFN